jgi:hypothetical protein
MEELLNKLRVIWKDKAKIRQEGSNRVELEVTYYMDKSEWKERMKDLRILRMLFPTAGLIMVSV